jgi:hypothetical protein
MIYYDTLRPPILWIEIAAVAALIYGTAAWTRRRNSGGWTQLVAPAVVGAPFFLESFWSFTEHDGYAERGWPFVILGIVASVIVATSWKARLLGPVTAALTGGLALSVVFLILGSDASSLL